MHSMSIRPMKQTFLHETRGRDRHEIKYLHIVRSLAFTREFLCVVYLQGNCNCIPNVLNKSIEPKLQLATAAVLDRRR